MFLYQRSVIDQLEALHIDDDASVIQQATDIYQCLSTLLGSNAYFYGSKPSSLDAVVFGHLSAQLYAPMPKHSLREEVQKFDNLVQFVERNAQIVFGHVPDVEKEQKRLVEVRNH
mgnify:CR=1 FL=1